MKKTRWAILLMICLVVLVTGCRGWRTEKPPIHPNPNFDWQPRFKAQTLSLHPPAGTVPWGQEYAQKTVKQSDRIPMTVTLPLLLRGQERFDIYCAVCHDRAGTGKGTIIAHGLVPPPKFGDARIVAYPDGALFNIITNGVRTMPGYKKQISEKDRWAIVGYIRALQKIQ